MNRNKISIILPAYNCEKVIERTIKSIEKQFFDFIELIIVNDGSTDNTREICLKYSEKNSKIKYVETENYGVSNARNIGISKAEGEYICFIDSDDEYYPSFINKINQYINGDKLLVFAYDRINVNSGKIRKMRICNDFNNQKEMKSQIEMLQANFLFNQVWNKVYLKKIIKENNIKFDIGLSMGEDYIFNLEYMKHIQNIEYIDEILYKYYTKETGLSLQKRDNKLKIKLENWKKNKELYNEKKWNLEYLYKQYIQICLAGISKFVFNKHFKENLKNNIVDYDQFKEIFKKSKSRKNKIIAKMFLKNKIIYLYIIGILARIYRKLYKKIKVD